MRKYFTLIELLVVIAIIAILAAMLLPALNQARERGRASKCTANVKNLAALLQFYNDDNDSMLPPSYINPDDKKMSWSTVMAEAKYVGDVTDPILFCPKNQTTITDSNARYFCYGLVSDVTTSLNRVYRSTKQRSNPSMLILIGDASDRTNGSQRMWQGLYNQSYTSYNGMPFLIHANAAPYAFLDGHVRSLGPSDWPSTTDNKYFWTGSNTNTARFRGYKLSEGTVVTY